MFACVKKHVKITKMKCIYLINKNKICSGLNIMWAHKMLLKGGID